MEFLVKVKGIHAPDEDRAAWVLAVDGDRLLIAHEDRSIHWHPLDECTFARVASPDQPRPVVVVQRGPQLAVPNRQHRRALERNGA